jgi:predicted TPR repeat methyltransferase
MAKDLALSFHNKHQGSEEFDGEAAKEAERLVQLAKLEPLTDGGVRTSQLLSQALATDPHNHEAQIFLERLYQMFVPRWHFTMLADKVRNRAYAEAIAAKVKPGDIVLDIGCGAGLTAMMAARAGAKHVYTCEQQPLIAQAAVRIIEDNGLTDRITVIPKMSHNLVVGEDLPERADVVISEIVDTVLLGEGALATLFHAMHRLAKPNARAIPERGTLKAQLVESDALFKLWRPKEAEGFKLGAFHHFSNVAHITPNDLSTCNLKPLGPTKDLFWFDFLRPDMRPARTTKHLACSTTGTIHAVFVFFEMYLSPDIKLSNGRCSGGHWGRTAFLLDRSLPAELGHLLPITAQHDTSQFSLSADKRITFAEDGDQAFIRTKHAWDSMDLRRDGNSQICSPIQTSYDAIIRSNPAEFEELSV